MFEHKAGAQGVCGVSVRNEAGGKLFKELLEEELYWSSSGCL